jgi:hypothetical protein
MAKVHYTPKSFSIQGGRWGKMTEKFFEKGKNVRFWGDRRITRLSSRVVEVLINEASGVSNDPVNV